MYENVNFPGWDVVRKIGEGSFGGVYEIHRTLPDGRVEKAALKKLTVPKDNSEIRELYSQSFSRETITAHYKEQVRELAKEYTLTQELNSCKNVVACHDVQCVQHADGIGWDIYIRMELLKPLKLVLSADYQEMTVLKLGLSLCNALLACQEHHIVHRDIKPENILVSDRGEFKLGDFGIAKVSEKTATGTMTGTMGYMAPEVANRWHYGAQADIYSLGMVLYWMMNRRTLPFLPFPPAIPTAAQRQDAANRRFAGEDFPPPVNGSRELKAIVMKACAFSTEERYQAVRELRRDLYACYQQRRAGKKPDVSIPVSTDEAIWTSESTSGNTYSGSRIIHSNGQNEKTGTFKPGTRKTGTLKTDASKTGTSKTNDPKTGRFSAPPEKPKKRRVALICVLAALCLCFASTTGYLLVYGVRLVRQSASAPETINRMQSDPFYEDTDDTDTLQVFLSGVLRKDVASITFLDTVTDAPEDSWDISEDGDGSVLAWVTGQAPSYDLYIAGEGGVRAPENCLGLFAGYFNATSITFGTAFDTSDATDMTFMFAACEKLTALDVHSFDTSHVTNMMGMFGDCPELSSLDISSLDTSLVTDMTYMFADCEKLTALDVQGFDTSHVTSMAGMFGGCSGLSSLDVSNFDTSLTTNMSLMFAYCNSLTSLDLSNFDTSMITDMSFMFSYCNSLTYLDLGSFDTSLVTDMNSMFDDCFSLTDLDLRSFNTSNVTDMGQMFWNCTSLQNLDLSSFDTSLVTRMSYMFYGCDNLTDLNLSSFDFSNVESYDCFMDDYRLYNGQRWEELFTHSASETASPTIESYYTPETSLPVPAIDSTDSEGIFSTPRTVVYVNTVNELLDSIAPNTEIVLTNDSYDLSTAKGYSEWSSDTCSGTFWESQYYRWDATMDGPTLIIHDVENLVIRSETGDLSRHTISTVPRYADVLAFENCNGVILQDFTAGHTKAENLCNGGVIKFTNCHSTQINSCGLFGCGTVGACYNSCTNASISNSDIYECSYCAVMAYDTSNISLINTTIRDINDAFIISSCENVVVDGRELPGEAYFGN